MQVSPEFGLQLLISIGSVAAVYGAIRGDLAALMARMKNAEDSTRDAHLRIDSILQKGKEK